MAFNSLPALSAVINALFLVAGLYIYGSLLRQIRARPPEVSTPDARTFGLPEAMLGLLLATWFLLNISAASSEKISGMHSRELILQGLVSIGILVLIATLLKLRRLDIDSLGGFSRVGFARAVGTGMVLILAAYPLVFIADLFTQRTLGGSGEKQGIVELFNASSTLQQRILIIVLAVAVAPIAEEFLFRFFLYGVLKRYFGRAVGLFANAFLFAAAHAHLPAFAPLLVLGGCFTLAYEWSGSLLVSMTMHACFNALSLIALAYPELFQQ